MRQVVAEQVTGEKGIGIGESGFELLAQGAIADDGQRHARRPRHIAQQVDAFLVGEAAHEYAKQRIRVATIQQPLAHRGRGMPRIEALGIHASSPMADAAITHGAQLANDRVRRRQRQMTAVVNITQPAIDRTREQREAIVLGITGQIGLIMAITGRFKCLPTAMPFTAIAAGLKRWIKSGSKSSIWRATTGFGSAIRVSGACGRLIEGKGITWEAPT